ncbi:MAG TPA: hypothetical protein VM204_08235 [Gaiellaceae bacterium]|nr:hypothetical protein [Gaiellaceae bacterium]
MDANADKIVTPEPADDDVRAALELALAQADEQPADAWGEAGRREAADRDPRG